MLSNFLRRIRSSLRHVSQRLKDLGHGISPPTVGRLLHKLGYSLHVNEKKLEASANLRNAVRNLRLFRLKRSDFKPLALQSSAWIRKRRN
ncbi:hypothetical protein [Ktedonobacter sp. SOSP1-52]|uniref:ISAzo13-like element transposase-related protein n=1 Tax=Ktedonobacter sp. SOSP1-52 TaxID=2778366 RepID=UPI0035B2792C